MSGRGRGTRSRTEARLDWKAAEFTETKSAKFQGRGPLGGKVANFFKKKKNCARFFFFFFFFFFAIFWPIFPPFWHVPLRGSLPGAMSRFWRSLWAAGRRCQWDELHGESGNEGGSVRKIKSERCGRGTCNSVGRKVGPWARGL